MDKRFVLPVVVALGLLASAARAGFRVGMVLPGSDADKGWNQMAREGLDRIKKELGAETKVFTNVKSSDFYTRASDLAEDGFDVVICHGGEFEKVAAAAAKAYPRTHFIVGGCPNDVPGAVGVEFLTRDASKLVGLVAARVTKTGKVAFVGADPVAPLQACYDGLSEGVRARTKDAAGPAPREGAGGAAMSGVSVLPALWTNSWDSPTIAREKTEAALAGGADVIYQNVDAAAPGVFQAVQDANKGGKWAAAFGCNSNQNALAPDVILGSVVLDIPKAYLDLTRDARDGKLKHAARKLGLPGGYVDLVLNEKHPAVTPDVAQQVAEVRKALLDSGK